MPVKKAAPRSKSPMMPPPIITMTESAVDVSLQSKVVPILAIACSVAMLMAFGSIIAAGVVGLTVPKPIETVETKSDYEQSRIVGYNSLISLVGNMADNVKYFDVYTKSKAQFGYAASTDQCYTKVPRVGGMSIVAVPSCVAGVNGCHLREGYVAFNYRNTSSTAVGNWEYNCQYGCSDGACLRTPITPVCSDSDINSITGQSDPFIAGSVVGLSNGINTALNDYCMSASALVEYSCAGNGQIASTTVDCKNGCINNACKSSAGISSVAIDGAVFSMNYDNFPDIQMFDGYGDVSLPYISIQATNLAGSFNVEGNKGVGNDEFGNAFPTYGIMSGSNSGGYVSYPKAELRSVYFNSNVLKPNSSSSRTYLGYMPIRITYNGKVGELRLAFKVKINPTVRTDYCSPYLFSDGMYFSTFPCTLSKTIILSSSTTSTVNRIENVSFSINASNSSNYPPTDNVSTNSYSYLIGQVVGFPNRSVYNTSGDGGATGKKDIKLGIQTGMLSPGTYNGYMPVEVTVRGAKFMMRVNLNIIVK